MNGLVAPKPSAPALSRWTRHAEFLVYLVPVGTISTELYDGYVRLLQAHSVIAIRSLTRPGGYAAELSPFRSFAWDGAGTIRFRFVSTTDKIDAFDGEDVHACARAVGVLGICHCPTTPSLPVAYQQFMDSIRHFPGLLLQKCFAFEHQFDLRTVEECAPLTHLVMFPVYHELDSSDSPNSDEVMSTVSLHLQVVLDTICVTILMSLESTVRAAVRQQQTQAAHAPSAAIELGDAAGFLLDTNIEPSSTAQLQQQHHVTALSPFPLREPMTSGAPSPLPRSLPGTPTSERPAAPSGGGVSSLFVSAETRNRKRHLARQRKLFGDYAVLLSCLPDAIEHYVTAIELLRDEERKSGGAPGDTLWLAAALEGYVFCLYQQCQDKFMVEIVEKASEAISLYAKAGVSELEISLVEHIGWYYTAVAVHLSALKGLEKVEEATWVKRLLWEVVERGVAVFPDVPTPRQVHFLIQCASMLESVGHHRRMALYLHEAVTLLAQRWRPTSGLLVTSPSSLGSHPHQRLQELRVALRLELITAQRLGMADRLKWEVTSLRRRTRRLRRLQRQQQQKKTIKVTLPMAIQEVEPWLGLRFHVLRQLVSIAKMLADPFLVGRHCIQLLEVLAWCDSIAQASPSSAPDTNNSSQLQLDQPQSPFSQNNGRASLSGTYRAGLHTRVTSGTGSNTHFSGVYATPPASIEVKSKRYFNMVNSPSATMSSAAATISSTIANTPRTLLATPRQQLSAAVNAISTKATPAFSSFSNSQHNMGMGSTPSSSSSSLSSRSSSASAVDLLNGSSSASAASLNGARGNLSDLEVAKPSNGLVTSETTPKWGHHAPDGVINAVWDLRSRPEIQRLQRRVLSILEAECAVMRPMEQLKLESFVQVDTIRVLHDTHRNPLLKKGAALTKYGVSTSGASDASAAQSPAFFYNPFDKKVTDAKPVGAASRYAKSDSESEDDEEYSSPSSGYEQCFPVHERVQVEVALSNPFGIDLDLQQVTVWVSTTGAIVPARSPSSVLGASEVEAYPSSLVLKAYERRKKIVLGVRGLRPGTFYVVGCFIKLLNIKTSFRMESPVQLDIVEPLPALSFTLVEIGSLSDEGEGDEAVKSADEAVFDPDASVSVTITDPICMFANETKRCVLHVHNTGQRAVQTLHATIRAGKAGISLSVAQAKTVISTLQGERDTSLLEFETERVHFKCLASEDSLAPILPLERGDHMTIPFEVSLRSLPRHSIVNRQEQLHWTFLYSEEKSSDPGSLERAVYYRESHQSVTLVPLGSLLIQNVQVLPTCSPMFVPPTGVTDHSSCIVAVEVLNPTETVFLVRLREHAPAAADAIGSAASGMESGCDVEVGRQCSRCLLVEVPRVEAKGTAQLALADALNQCLELTWKTYFGTTGCLLFHDGLWTENECDSARLQLTRPEVCFRLQAGDGLVPSESDDPRNELLKQEVRFPFRFYLSHDDLGYQTKEFSAKLLETCVIHVCVRQPVSSNDDQSMEENDLALPTNRYIEAEVVVVRDSETSANNLLGAEQDTVMMAGQTKRVLSIADADATVDNGIVEWQWRIACMFLSEGSFEVAVSGQTLGVDEDGEEVVLSHGRLFLHCRRDAVLVFATGTTAKHAEKGAMQGEYFQPRRLIWDDICPHVRPSEADELRRAIGNQLIDENAELKQELGLLVEILSEFQRQSDCIREALLTRRQQRMPEPPGRALLVEKLKLLASDLSNTKHRVLQSPKEQEVMAYVLSVDESSQRGDSWVPPPTTPRMADLDFESFPLSPRNGVVLRPGTSSGTRPSTASSQSRPVSRGSTLSLSSSTSSIVESPEVRKRLNVEEIDSIKDDVQEALLEEKQQLLEDIEFIQSCIDMEQELLDDDTRQIAKARPPPSLQDLHELRRTLEKSLEDQDDVERLNSILRKTDVPPPARRPSHTLHPVMLPTTTLPRPPPREREPRSNTLSKQHDEPAMDDVAPKRSQSRRASTDSYSTSGTKVLKIRFVIQEARDEPFLT